MPADLAVCLPVPPVAVMGHWQRLEALQRCGENAEYLRNNILKHFAIFWDSAGGVSVPVDLAVC